MERRSGGNLKRKQASASEGGEILRRKKEMMAALCADDDDLFSCTALTAEDAQQPEDGKARKKKKVVKQRLPMALIQYMKDTPHPTTDELSEEELAKHSKEYREVDYVRDKFRSDKIRAYFQAIIDQYEARGYAEDETEVTDDEEEAVGN
jgi:hypothetical protein